MATDSYRCGVILIIRLRDGFDHNLRVDGESTKLVGVIWSGIALPRCSAI